MKIRVSGSKVVLMLRCHHIYNYATILLSELHHFESKYTVFPSFVKLQNFFV
jgi:hypothetical protein